MIDIDIIKLMGRVMCPHCSSTYGFLMVAQAMHERTPTVIPFKHYCMECAHETTVWYRFESYDDPVGPVPPFKYSKTSWAFTRWIIRLCAWVKLSYTFWWK